MADSMREVAQADIEGPSSRDLQDERARELRPAFPPIHGFDHPQTFTSVSAACYSDTAGRLDNRLVLP